MLDGLRDIWDRGTRWNAAQDYERSYWEQRSQQIETGSSEQLHWYRGRATRLTRRIEKYDGEDVGRLDRVVEVGNGPVGILSFLEADDRVGIDPLQRFFAGDPALSQLRSSAVLYVEGKGERLPVPDHTTDLAIIDNCIDHVESVDRVLSELRRILKPDGHLYLAVNCRTVWGYWVHRLLSRLYVDRGHPHTFTVARLRHELLQHFAIRDMRRRSFLQAWWEDLNHESLRAKLKAILGVSEFVVDLVAVPASSATLVSETPGAERPVSG